MGRLGENCLLETSASLLAGFSHQHALLPEVSPASTEPGHILHRHVTVGTAHSLSLPICFLQQFITRRWGLRVVN